VRGVYVPDMRAIALDSRLGKRIRLAVLAHEFGHVVLRHGPRPYQEAKYSPYFQQERRASVRGLRELQRYLAAKP
jgi:hypothetical protein